MASGRAIIYAFGLLCAIAGSGRCARHLQPHRPGGKSWATLFPEADEIAANTRVASKSLALSS